MLLKGERFLLRAKWLALRWYLGEEDLGFGFDDEECVVVGMAGGAEFVDGIVECGSKSGEDDGAVVAADKVKAGFLLDELELDGHLQWIALRADAGRRRTAPTAGEERI